MHRGPLSLASYEWAHRGRWDPVEIVQWYHLALRAWGAFFFCPKLVPATPNLMAVSRRAWIVPLPSTFSNSAGGAYGHTAGNRRTWQTQKAGSGVNKILCRMMYLLIYFFFRKTKVSKFISCRVQFCVLQQPFFLVEVFFSMVFQRPCRPVVAASHHQVMPSVGCSTCPSLTSSGSPTETTTQRKWSRWLGWCFMVRLV